MTASVIRGLTARWLEEAGHTVVATCNNGRVAVDQIARAKPEIVLLDIEMPEMDGITALPLMLAKCPGVSIVVVSTLTQRNAQTSLKCLSLGAVDYLAKPESHRGVTTSLTFRQDLLIKIQGLAPRHRDDVDAALTAPVANAGARSFRVERAAPGAPRPGQPAPAARQFLRAPAPVAPRLRRQGRRCGPALRHRRVRRARHCAPWHRIRPRDSSWSAPRRAGPARSASFLQRLRPSLRGMPVLVVQHMPPVFTAVFAEHLGAQTGMPAAEAKDGEPLQSGRIYVAPGGKHMGLRRSGAGVALRLDDGAPVNFCKPAVDVLFFDAATIFGGTDPFRGAHRHGIGWDPRRPRDRRKPAARSSSRTRATSTVWGMPGSIAKAGLAHEILPLRDLAGAAKRYLGGGK